MITLERQELAKNIGRAVVNITANPLSKEGLKGLLGTEDETEIVEILFRRQLEELNFTFSKLPMPLYRGLMSPALFTEADIAVRNITFADDLNTTERIALTLNFIGHIVKKYVHDHESVIAPRHDGNHPIYRLRNLEANRWGMQIIDKALTNPQSKNSLTIRALKTVRQEFTTPSVAERLALLPVIKPFLSL